MSTSENPAPEAYSPARSPARAHLAEVIALLGEARRIDVLTSTPQSHVAVRTLAVAAQDAALAVIADEEAREGDSPLLRAERLLVRLGSLALQ